MKKLKAKYLYIVSVFWLVLITTLSIHGAAYSEEPGLTPLPANTPLRFEALSLEQGLSQSVVNVTYQDREGYLWFGTQDGLNRYDGYQFTIFRPNPDDANSINDPSINSLIEDNDGNLWIGTRLGGLNRYDRLTGSFTNYLHDPDHPDGLAGNCVRSLLIDTEGMLWIGSDGGLDVFDPQKETFLAHYRNDPDDSNSIPGRGVDDIYQDRSGVIWIASEDGLSSLDGATGSFTHFVHHPDDPDSLGSNHVNRILEGQDGDLWVGTDLGLERMDRETQTFKHYLPDSKIAGSLSNLSVNDILEDHNHNLWIATYDGLNLLDREADSFTVYHSKEGDPTSLSNSTILSLYEDREGILWIGTFGGGVNKYDPGQNKFPILQYDPKDPKDISSFGLMEDHTGQLWFTMYGEGLLRLNRETGETTFYRHDPANPDNSLLDDFVWTINESRDGLVWVGGSQGLNVYDPETGQFTFYKHNPLSPDDPKTIGGRIVGYTLEDRQGNIWIGMPTGLDRLERKTGTFTHYQHDPKDPSSLSQSGVAYIFESQSGEIWLAMHESGISKLDKETGQFTHYRHDINDPQSISSDGVLMMMQDHTGVMWLATNQGLNKFDPLSGKAIRYTVKNGLPNDVIYGIVEDDQGALWLSTNYGLSRFDPNTNDFQNYDFNDGLQSNEFNSFAFAKTRGGEIIFAGIKGTNIFRPGEIKNNAYVPPIVLTRLAQGGEEIKIERDNNQPVITLHWPYNFFEFEFSALSYSNPAKNEYAYRLDKFDQDWVVNGTNTSGRYTNLPGGTYTLNIKGSNNDGLWNETGTTITVKVVPPFWQTWWFQGTIVAVVAASVLAVYRFRIRSIESYNRDLKKQVAERTQEIENLFEQTKELAIIEERNRLARDLHDSAKQKAFAALAQLGAVRSMIDSKPGLARNHLAEVEELVYEVIQELTFLIQEMYPMALKEKGLVAVLFEYLYEYENRNSIHVNLSVKQERRLPLEIEQALYRIIQESLANVARHSQANEVKIGLEYHDASVKMVLTDNGCGFDVNKKPGGVGLRTMRERAVMIGGSFEITSSPGNGTRIELFVPIPPSDKSTAIGVNGGQNDTLNNHSSRR